MQPLLSSRSCSNAVRGSSFFLTYKPVPASMFLYPLVGGNLLSVPEKEIKPALFDPLNFEGKEILLIVAESKATDSFRSSLIRKAYSDAGRK
jgi:hypothetical protein